MERLPKLGLVACYGVGIDAIDKGWCAAHGIPVTNTPDVLTEDVADMAFALLLGVARQVPQADAWVRDGRLDPGRLHAADHAGLGQTHRHRRPRPHRPRGGAPGGGFRHGRSATAAARRSTTSSYPWHPTPAALAPNVDILVCCAMGGPTTQGLIDRAAFEALRARQHLRQRLPRLLLRRGGAAGRDPQPAASAWPASTSSGTSRRSTRHFTDFPECPAGAACGERHGRDPQGHGPADARQRGGAFRRPARC